MPADDQTARRFRVLIVDDEEPLRTFVQRVLQQRYETAIAAGPVEAMQRARTEGPFDLVVTDVNMPKMAGDELAAQLRREDPALRVLYLTGFSDQLFARRNALWEGEAFLEKPTTVQGLLEAAALILGDRIPPPRAPRVRVPDARVSVANGIWPIVLLNVNGLLAHITADVQIGSVWPLILEFPSVRLHVTGRVVSVEPARTVAMEAAAEGFHAVAFAFIHPSEETRGTLEYVCREHGVQPPTLPTMIS